MPKPNRIPTPDGCKCCSRGLKCVNPLGPVLPATTEHFFRNRAKPDGFQPECKMCCRIRSVAHYAEHREEEIAKSMEYHRKHPEQKKINDKRDRERRANKIAAYQKEYWVSHAAKRTEICARYYDNHTEEITERNNRWRESHPDAVRAMKQRRKARKRNLPDIYTDADYRRAKVYFNYRCAYCGNGPKESDLHWLLHQDHFMPLGKPNCPGSVPWNIVPACQDCNLRKGHKNPYEWIPARFGSHKSKRIVARIETFLDAERNR